MVGRYILPRTGSSHDPLRLGVLISGSGSGLEALLYHQEANACSHETVVVISDKAGVKGLDRATAHGVMAVTVPLPPREEFAAGGEGVRERRRTHEESVSAVLEEYEVELVVCSGYMRILTADFLAPRLGRVVNIHPSPWGDEGALYPGAHGIRDTLASGASTAGASVHFVSAGVDDGPLIASETTAILPDEDEDSLGERIRIEIEHHLYPAVIDALAEGQIETDGERFRVN
jgi:formyltetrahydrofolate-dependent phosphoribosylglycinamide formyltransferase